LNRLIRHVRSNAVAYLALFVALGGTSYAALNLPANSVGGRQIRNHVIDPVKLNPKYVAGSVRAWASVNSKGKIVASSGGARIVARAGIDQLTWRTRFFRHCVPSATVKNPTGPGGPSSPGFADASSVAGPRSRLTVLVSTFTLGPVTTDDRLPYFVLVTCPVPAK
jgi:hypothetical protein